MTDSFGRRADQLARFAHVLLDRSRWVYQRLSDSERFGVDLQEETLTEDLLLDIAMEMEPYGLQVDMFNKPQEARLGADWEWWFQGPRTWFGVRVQAKRLKRRNNRSFYDVGYRVGGTGELQVEVLRSGARDSQPPVAAAYAFYNGPLDLSGFVWSCRQVPREPRNFGVSVLSADVVRALHDASTVDLASVASVSHPFPCLVSPFGPGPGCGGWAPWPGSGPGERLELDQVAAYRFFGATYAGLRQVAPYLAEGPPSEYVYEQVRRYSVPEPPDYVRRLAGGDRDISRMLPPSVSSLSLFRAP